MTQRSLKSISRNLQRCFKCVNAVSGLFQVEFKDVFICPSRFFELCVCVFHGCFKKVLRLFTENFMCGSRKVKGCFKEVSRVFQG